MITNVVHSSRGFGLLAIATVLCLPQLAEAATHYVATNGSDSAPGSSAQPWATFAHAFANMAGGDTLIIKDGAYDQSLSNMPSGSAAQYTQIKAEHDFKVTVHGSGSSVALGINADYVQVEGIKVDAQGAREPVWVSGHYVKVLRCSMTGAVCEGNSTTATTITGSSDVLFEDCWAWGCGRYKFIAYESERVIFRRCVARHDYQDPSGFGEQCANFTSYDSSDTIFQNCIALDSGAMPEQYGDLDGALWFPEAIPAINPATIQGTIVLNVEGGYGALNDPSVHAARIIKDLVVWDSIGGGEYGNTEGGDNPSYSVDHVTFGNIWGTRTDAGPAWGVGLSGLHGFPAKITNSILYQCKSNGVGSNLESDYNDFFGNGQDFGIAPSKGPGAHDKYVDPKFKYIVRIEDDSPLKGAASDGTDIGATVVNRYGAPGTLYGEPGYDTLTNIPLWPFPNEAEIKKDMSSWAGPQDGKRGFCADGTGRYGGPITLTSYIWEYLGNACPNDLCTRQAANPDLSSVGGSSGTQGGTSGLAGGRSTLAGGSSSFIGGHSFAGSAEWPSAGGTASVWASGGSTTMGNSASGGSVPRSSALAAAGSLPQGNSQAAGNSSGPAGSAEDSGAGCGCRTAGTPSAGWTWTALAAAIMLFRRARARRRSSSGRPMRDRRSCLVGTDSNLGD